MPKIKNNKVKVISTWYDKDEENAFFDIAVKGRKFKNVEAKYTHRCDYCEESKCVCLNCAKGGFTIRNLDCARESAKVFLLYSLVTVVLVSIFSSMVWYKFPFYEAIRIIIAGCVVLSVICFLIESLVKFLWNEAFYEKIKREENKKREQEIKRKKAEEERKAKQQSLNPYYKEVREAHELVADFIAMSKKYDFDGCNDIIEECAIKLNEVLKAIEKNNASYKRTRELFAILPEMNNLLAQYVTFIEANCISQEEKKILKVATCNFLEYLKKQKAEAIFNTSEDMARISFQTSAEVINSISNKGDLL